MCSGSERSSQGNTGTGGEPVNSVSACMPGQKLGPVALQQPVSSIDSERSRADATGTDQSCHVGV
eukprot:15111991-Alexandrium_andersonii.AAC.1